MLYYTQEVREMKRTRKSIRYRVNHYFNTLTYEDIKGLRANLFSIISEVLLGIAILILLFVAPALFH